MGSGSNEDRDGCLLAETKPVSPILEKSAGNSNEADTSGKKGDKYQQLMIDYPQYMSQTMVSFLVFLMAATMKGESV